MRTLLAATIQHLRKFGHALILRTKYSPQGVLEQVDDKGAAGAGDKVDMIKNNINKSEDRPSTHLQKWQLRQCKKQNKEKEKCEKEFERENFNWEKHLMLWLSE